jgi:hypothetical protein
MEIKPCWLCNSNNIEIEQEDAITYKPYVRCWDCGNEVAAIRFTSRWDSDRHTQAIQIWNEDFDKNCTKLQRYLLGVTDKL